MKVLVVDDEQIALYAMQALLSTCGFEVQTASDGPQTLEIAKTFVPDVVIIDWMLGLPMDGLALAEALRELQPSVRIVIISGYSDVQQTAPDDAPYTFLVKPFQPAELLELLEDVKRQL